MHGAELTRLAREAEDAEARGALADAASAWRRALELLPPEAGQAGVLRVRLETLARRIEREGPGSPSLASAGGTGARSRLGGSVGAVSGLGLLAWKFKTVLLLVLGKGKLFFLGLTKASTLLSMAASVGVYWTVWGWRFALGLVASIYVHEMGHVFALRRFGIAASAPMFVPGFGAYIRSHQVPTNERESARIGLAGPLWGLGATVAVYAAHLATGYESLAAIARAGAWINLFNLLPVATLDGGRGFSALTRGQRALATAALAGLWVTTHEGLLLLLAVCGAARTFMGRAPREPDWEVLGQYVVLAALLSAATLIGVETGLAP